MNKENDIDKILGLLISEANKHGIETSNFNPDEEKLQRLTDFIGDLSRIPEDQIGLIDPLTYVSKLKQIYTPDFRHFYFRIEQVIINLKIEERDYLSANINIIYDYVKEHENTNAVFYKSFCKLYDHVNSGIIRLVYLDSIKKEQGSLQEESKILNQRVGKTSKKVGKLLAEIKNSAIQSITILGIFSAIVFAFTGGFNIIGYTFNGINTIYRLRFIFTLLLICFILFNTVFGLIYALSRMSEKKIYCNCYKCSNNKNQCPCANNCKLFVRLMHHYPIPILTNAVILLGLFLSFIFWIFEIMKIIKL